jgi:Rieske Fe-S protein
MSCDDCLSRREFLTRSTLAVAGMAVVATGCGDGDIGGAGITTPTGGVTTIQVSSLPGLATVGQLVVIPPASKQIAVKRTGPATFVALSMVCTHQGSLIALTGNSFECPNHGSRFDSDGNVTRQPQQTTGSATPLVRYTTSYDQASDTLTIR